MVIFLSLVVLTVVPHELGGAGWWLSQLPHPIGLLLVPGWRAPRLSVVRVVPRFVAEVVVGKCNMAGEGNDWNGRVTLELQVLRSCSGQVTHGREKIPQTFLVTLLE